MNEIDHGRWREELAAYMLGALEPGEEAELERHAETCEECRAELRWLQPAVDLLPDRVERREAPPALRERVLAEARADVGQADSAKRSRMPFSRYMRAGGWRPVAVGAVAALMLVAAIGYAGRDGGSGGGATTVAAVDAPAMSAELVMVGNSATLQLADVRALPEDKVLEAWVQRNGVVRPVRGLFVPDHEGRAQATIPDMRGVEVVMVTAEPPGGSETPTGSPMVTLEVPT